MRFTILPYRQLSAAANMAVDAGMIALSRTRGAVCFRYYGWTEAAITFGYSQPAGTVCNGMDDHSLARIRRETGGGIVDHRRLNHRQKFTEQFMGPWNAPSASGAWPPHWHRVSPFAPARGRHASPPNVLPMRNPAM